MCVCVCVCVCVCARAQTHTHTHMNFIRSTSVIRVGVAYVNVHVSRHLKEELAWAVDKRLWLIINTVLFKTVIPLRI